MRTLRLEGWLAACVVLVGSNLALATDVFNLGGVRDPVTGTWTGLASVELVPVGNPGNAPDTRYSTPGYGAVSYNFNLGKFDVTAGQYAQFLNAVATTDTYGLYSTYMDTLVSSRGCNIKRTGSSGSFVYSVASDWANRPVNYVSWGSAARFVNWLTNGQPSGGQNLSTTEDGSYYLNGANTNATLIAASRIPDANRISGKRYYFIPSEDEWYKAAYYDPNKLEGAGYWDYATRSNAVPSNDLSSTGTNNANYQITDPITHITDWTIGDPYGRTEVGAFASSPSAYGTFDQCGNVWNWNETVIIISQNQSDFGLRGGGFYYAAGFLCASYRSTSQQPDDLGSAYGFRVSEVPEPATLSLLALGGLAIVRRRRRR